MSRITLSGNASGTGNFTLASPNSNTDRTLTLPDNTGTVLTTASTLVLPKGGPAFSAYMGSNQVVTASTVTKLQYNIEDFDTASCYDTSTYRFTPNVAGYYQVTGLARLSVTSQTFNQLSLYKNGTLVKEGPVTEASGTYIIALASLVYLNGSTDYIELYGQTTGGTPTFASSSTLTAFQAALVRAD
jgi:hypothetical protein